MSLMGLSLADYTHLQPFIFSVNCKNWFKNNAAVTIWYLKIYRYQYQSKLKLSEHIIILENLSPIFVPDQTVLLHYYSDIVLHYFNIFTLRNNWCSYCVPVSTCLILFFSSLSQSRNIGIAVTTGSKTVHHWNRKFLSICNFRKSMDNMKTKWQSRSRLISINIQF